MLRLIVNADDFGLTSGVNRAILEAHRNGIVTSSTLMPTGRAFLEAVQIAQTMPNLSIGCHLTLVDGIPVLERTRVATLLGKDQNDGFRRGFGEFATASCLKRISSDEVEAEATAQIRKLQDAGIPVTHFDTHKHIHLFPAVLKPLLRAAKACNINAVRNPFGPVRIVDLQAQPASWKRWTQVGMLNALSGKFRRTVAKSGLRTTDGTIGVIGTGSMNAELFRLLMETIPDGTWEFVCHPGYVDADLEAARTRLLNSREVELKMLTAATVKDVLRSRGADLISYHDLTH